MEKIKKLKLKLTIHQKSGEPMQERRFTRRIEDFVCEKCGTFVKGNGYTDHCPKCLWSKHVDVYPGDRKSTCKGLMEPIGVDIKHNEYILIYRCTKCGYMTKCKAAPEDDFEEILKLVNKVKRP
jgi:rubrerythrin